MNELTERVKKRIKESFDKYSYMDFWKHNDLVAMSCDAEMFLTEDESYEELEIEEVAFVVDKKWLIDFMNREHIAMSHNGGEWNSRNLRHWLRNEYTSVESTQIYIAALEDNAIVMIDFN